MRRERAFLDVLARVTAYRLEGHSLSLLAGEDVAVRLESGEHDQIWDRSSPRAGTAVR